MSITSKAVTRMVLDMGKVDVQKSVAFTKGDVNRRWEVTLVDNGSPFDVPNNWTVALSAIKPDGNPIYNGCVVEHGRIVYDFASGEQLVTSEGFFAAEFDVFDETGQPVCSPRVWIQVLPVARNLAPITSDPQFTLLRQFLERAGDLEEDITELRDEMGNVVMMGRVVVSRAAWRGSPLSAVLSIPGLPRNSATLLYPADAVTRAEAAHSEIAAWVEDVEGHDPVITLEAASAPSGTLTFIYAIIRSERTGRPLSVAAIMGVGGGDSEPGSLRYVSDGKGRVTVLGKMVETTDATARNLLAQLRADFEQVGGGQLQRIEVLEESVTDLKEQAEELGDQVDDLGKQVDDLQQQFDNLDVTVEIPYFDLVELGLPDVPVEGGEKVTVQTDATGMIKALFEGAVRFRVNLYYRSLTLNLVFTLHDISSPDGTSYFCSHALDLFGGVPMLLYMQIEDGKVTAGITLLEEDTGEEEPATAELPTFDLVALGLPSVPVTGEQVFVQTDTTEIREALDKGAVRFYMQADISGEVMPFDTVMTPMRLTDAETSTYMCSKAVTIINGEILNIFIIEGAIAATVTTVGGAKASIPATSIDLSALDTEGKVVETYADGTSKTTTLEFDSNGNPVKITDGDGNVTTLIW